jgi:uncharacterized membrane protein YjjB (DUF3815 family)
MNTLWILLQDAFFAAIPAVGFAMIFNVPVGALRYCALAGALGHCTRLALFKFAGLPLEWATLLVAAGISFLGVQWAQKWRAHPKVFTVAAVIPMIPGVSAFNALHALLVIAHTGFTTDLFAVFVNEGLKATFITFALALGLAAPGLLLYRRRPVV